MPLILRSERGLEKGRKVTWLELFFDLVFVAAIAQAATHLRDDYSQAGLFRFALLFVLIWWAWLGHTTFSTRFDTDDAAQRAFTALQLFLVAVMAINATGALDSRDSAGFAAAYAVMRLVLAGQFWRARHVLRARPLTTRYAVGCAAAAAVWLGSAFLDAPLRFGAWALALTIDVATPLLTTRHLVDVPHDAAHLPERYGLFSIILIGESIAAVMTGMGHQEYWSTRAAAAAILSMAGVFGLWWTYFDGVDATAHRMVRSMADAKRFQLWSYVHLPLYIGIVVMGVGLERVIEKAAEAPLSAPETIILAGAVVSVAASLAVIKATTDSFPRRLAQSAQGLHSGLNER